jgi:hypothetical protein
MFIYFFVTESCFQIRNFPINIETTNIKYRIVAEVFKGGRKFSRVRLVVKNKDAATHTKEQIVLVRKNSLDGCFRELVYLKEGTTDITTPIKFLGEVILFSSVEGPRVLMELAEVTTLIVRNRMQLQFEWWWGGGGTRLTNQNPRLPSHIPS